MVKRVWTTMQAAIPRGLFVLLACVVLGVVPRAEASPFLLNLVESGSSDGGHVGGGGEHAARLGLRVTRPDLLGFYGGPGVYKGLGLAGLARTSGSTVAPWTSSHLGIGLVAALKPSHHVAATSVADVGFVASTSLASVTQLDLGDGAHLSVSDSVGAALADAISSSASSGDVASPPATPTVLNDVKDSTKADVTGNNSDGQSGPGSGYNPVSPLPDSTASGAADESVKAILTDIASGIISSDSEQTYLAAAGDFAAAGSLVQNPEPATLILLASALAIDGKNGLRRRQTPKAHQSCRSARCSEPRYVVVRPGEIAMSKASGS